MVARTLSGGTWFACLRPRIEEDASACVEDGGSRHDKGATVQAHLVCAQMGHEAPEPCDDALSDALTRRSRSLRRSLSLHSSVKEEEESGESTTGPPKPRRLSNKELRLAPLKSVFFRSMVRSGYAPPLEGSAGLDYTRPPNPVSRSISDPYLRASSPGNNESALRASLPLRRYGCNAEAGGVLGGTLDAA
eukprot:CAMPEP_0180217686 /NCGR_PEP_ID=MMETSP0987-20121128/17126_1 /TAXON_ID=697907 /ORGANISM="non described non described, Strain CCMP2293" /LENGTH=190 /DNA_ID=CAMNT_0022177357 /DNA_START=63 /DNA_END=635 /DNA_ORIENTATION=+